MDLLLEPFSSIPMNNFTLLSTIEPSHIYSPSTNWHSADDQGHMASDDTNPPLVQSRSLSPNPLESYLTLGSRFDFSGAEECSPLVPSSSPSSSSVSLSTTDSDYSSLFSPGTSALTSPASSVLSLDDSRRSCSVFLEVSESASRFSSPSMHSRTAKEESGENDTDIVTRDSRRASLKGRRRWRRHDPISSGRQRQVPSGDPQDRDLLQPDQELYTVAVDENGPRRPRPTCLCGKSFTRLSDLKRHNLESTSCPLATNRTDGKKTKADPRFVCNRCGGAFSRYDSLDRHRKNRGACLRAARAQKKSLGHGESDSDTDDDDQWR